MSHDQRQSPRAAITNWISNTVAAARSRESRSNPEQSERDVQSDHYPPREKALQARESRSRHRNQKSATKSGRHRKPRVRQEEGRSCYDVSQIDHQQPSPRRSRHRVNSKVNEPPIANSNGLHAPSRAPRNRDDYGHTGANVHHPSRKRRYESSATSSSLEYATASTRSVSSCSDGTSQRNSRQSHTKMPEAIDNSIKPSSSPKPVDRSFERRPRRKTREDRYELKESKDKRRKKESKSQPTRDKGSRRRKRKEKSSANLMHEFSAENVSSERLTVRFLQCSEL